MLYLQFFRPLRPVYINISYNDQGKPSGEAYVEFATYDEAIRAMDLVSIPFTLF